MAILRVPVVSAAAKERTFGKRIRVSVGHPVLGASLWEGGWSSALMLSGCGLLLLAIYLVESILRVSMTDKVIRLRVMGVLGRVYTQ